jgi:hypothetical protein
MLSSKDAIKFRVSSKNDRRGSLSKVRIKNRDLGDVLEAEQPMRLEVVDLYSSRFRPWESFGG